MGELFDYIVNKRLMEKTMTKLSEELFNYLELNVNQLLLPTMLKAFEILDDFELPFYEDKYLDIIYNEDVDPMDTPFLLRETLHHDLKLIVKSHKIEVHRDPAPSLEELVEITSLLYKLQNLEDYYLIERILSTLSTNEYKLATIIQTYTSLDLIAALDTIASVDDEFIEALNEYINNFKEAKEGTRIDHTGHRLTSTFFRYLGEQETIGSGLFNKGFMNHDLTFEQLLDIVVTDIPAYIRKELKKSQAHAAINILSVLMLCKDAREQPMTFFKTVSDVLIVDPNEVTTVYNIMSNMHSEFLQYYKDSIEEEANEDDR